MTCLEPFDPFAKRANTMGNVVVGNVLLRARQFTKRFDQFRNAMISKARCVEMTIFQDMNTVVTRGRCFFGFGQG